MTLFVYGMLLQDAAAVATLEGHQLDFWDSLATVTPAEGGVVYGGVIEVDEDLLRRYDAIEGVDFQDQLSDRGLYRREAHHLADGIEAWVYVKNRRNGYRQAPSPFYYGQIRDDYERLGLPVSALMTAADRAVAFDAAREESTV